MIGGSRTVGIGLMVGSGVLLLAFLGWLFAALQTNETSTGGMVLGVVLLLAILLPIFGSGFYLLRRGISEKQDFAQLHQQKTLLNMVLTQGQVTIPELVADLQLPRDTIEALIRDLVGKRLFSGAINWDKGILYSVESRSLVQDRQCPNCGGKLTFAGKGLIACSYCGSEVFLTENAAQKQ